jgi:hypothetical protein
MSDTKPETMRTRACRYCGKPDWPYCMNSRDMEQAAIEGSDRCLTALEREGWGEAGERYVRLNREALSGK